jgi:hypothetical protein
VATVLSPGCRYVEQAVLVDFVHHRCFVSPVVVVVLLNTQAIYSYIPSTQPPCESDSIPEGLR